MEEFSLPVLKTISTFLTWATFWLAIFAAGAGWLSAQVRSETGRRSDLRVATAEQEAAQASSAAAVANARAETLKSENLATQERLIAAERSLEAERRARLELERRVAARRVSIDQVDKIKLHLTSLSHVNQRPVTAAVFATTATGEANIFADQLAVAVESCGFIINRNTVHYGQPYDMLGVGILTSDNPDAIARGEAFRVVLDDIGFFPLILPTRVAHRSDNQGEYMFDQNISLMIGDRPI